MHRTISLDRYASTSFAKSLLNRRMLWVIKRASIAYMTISFTTSVHRTWLTKCVVFSFTFGICTEHRCRDGNHIWRVGRYRGLCLLQILNYPILAYIAVDKICRIVFLAKKKVILQTISAICADAWNILHRGHLSGFVISNNNICIHYTIHVLSDVFMDSIHSDLSPRCIQIRECAFLRDFPYRMVSFFVRWRVRFAAIQ